MGSPHLSSPIQIVRTFRIETRKASKAVARRKVRPCSFLALGVPKGLTQRNEEFFFPSAFVFRSEVSLVYLFYWRTEA